MTRTGAQPVQCDGGEGEGGHVDGDTLQQHSLDLEVPSNQVISSMLALAKFALFCQALG